MHILTYVHKNEATYSDINSFHQLVKQNLSEKKKIIKRKQLNKNKHEQNLKQMKKNGRRKWILVFKNAVARDIGSNEEENSVGNKPAYRIQHAMGSDKK